MGKIKSVLKWPGGKGNMIGVLTPLVETPHTTYVEVFGGGAALLLAKRPSEVEVYNDIDSGLVSLFRVLRDPDLFRIFYRRVVYTLLSRQEYEESLKALNLDDDKLDLLERAYHFYVIARQSFGGIFGNGWGYLVSHAKEDWISGLSNLPWIHKRLLRVQIEHEDFRIILDRYDTPDTLFYLDPPYVMETRRSKLFRFEMSLEDHRDLVEKLLNLKGKAILSGYDHEVYRPLGKEYVKKTVLTSCHLVGRTKLTGYLGSGAVLKNQPREECLWIKRSALTQLPLFSMLSL